MLPPGLPGDSQERQGDLDLLTGRKAEVSLRKSGATCVLDCVST